MEKFIALLITFVSKVRVSEDERKKQSWRVRLSMSSRAVSYRYHLPNNHNENHPIVRQTHCFLLQTTKKKKKKKKEKTR